MTKEISIDDCLDLITRHLQLAVADVKRLHDLGLLYSEELSIEHTKTYELIYRILLKEKNVGERNG